MNIYDFIDDVKNKGGVDTDGAYGKQCMDLWNYYAQKVLELEKGKTGASCAKQILNNKYVMDNVERINNYPAFIPKLGDVCVWTGGQYGHTAICLNGSNVNILKTLDQNWQKQKLTEETHNYTYLAPLVFLRPKNQKNISEQLTEFTVRVDKEEANVRKEPSSKSAIVPQPNNMDCLKKGDTFTAVAIVEGENVNGNNKWYKSKKGNYVWSHGLSRV